MSIIFIFAIVFVIRVLIDHPTIKNPSYTLKDLKKDYPNSFPKD